MTQRTTAGEIAGLGECKAARDASALPSPAAGLRRGIPVDPRSRHKSAECVPGTFTFTKRRPRQNRGTSWVIAAALVLTLAFLACTRPTLVRRTFVLDYNGTSCDDCSEAERNELQQILLFRGDPTIAAWVRASFIEKPTADHPAQSLKGENDDFTYRQLSDMLYSEFRFDNGVSVIDYNFRSHPGQDRCDGRLTRRRPDGAVMWERTVPVITSVVFPFFTKHNYFFVGGPDSRLVIGDAETGRVLETFSVPLEPQGFGNPNSTYCLPFMVGSHLVLEGSATMDTRRHKPPGASCGPFFLTKTPSVYVLELDLPPDDLVDVPGGFSQATGSEGGIQRGRPK